MIGSQSVDVIRAGASPGDDAHGNPLPGVDAEFPIAGCSVQPGDGAELLISRDQITTIYTVWAPLEPRVLDTDSIRYAGTVYPIDGPVERWELGSDLDHQVIRLQRVEG